MRNEPRGKQNSDRRNEPRHPKSDRTSRRVVKPARDGAGKMRGTGLTGESRTIQGVPQSR